MLKGKVALVTGAGGEIGRASALLFAREGARLIVSDLSLDSAAETARLIQAAGGVAHAVRTDIADRESVAELIRFAIEACGRLDCAFNNAGINLQADSDWDLEAFSKTIDINVQGTMYCMTAEGGWMMKAGGGCIVNNASTFGLVGSSRQPGYAASKHAIVGMTRTAALRWARSGMRVNAVCPGPVETSMTRAAMNHSPEIRARILSASPMNRLAQVTEVAEAALWLCSERASFINGVALPVDGGFTAG